ncbi:MAG TPA: glutamine amidotransferase [Rhodanobacteraceae bacterium]|nr:glutamine amidotransferase [Rhodanobacteraceae bacterium]
MKPVLIIVTGHAPAPIRARLGDFDHWFRVALRLPPSRVQAIDAQHAALPAPHAVAGAVITGSSAMVTDRAAWSEHLAGWIRTAMDASLPLFGVCYGHQLMAHALGGRVDDLPGGREIGTQRIEWLDGEAPAFRAHTTHQQAVLEAPAGARVLARSPRDARQILEYGPRAMSTQFHPEFSAAAMRGYIALRAGTLRDEGMDVAALLRDVGPAPQARLLLRRFARHCAPAA